MPIKELAGFGVNGVRRPALLRTLIEEAQAQGVPVKFGHQLVSFNQHEDSVTVKFANGTTDTASLVVGCDGLHSDTRVTLFGKEPVSFTGLTQVSSVACCFPRDTLGKHLLTVLSHRLEVSRLSQRHSKRKV